MALIADLLPGFSDATCIPHDFMHDLFEAKTFNTQIKKYFTIDFLNNQIRQFDFIYDMPSLLDSNLCGTNMKIRQTDNGIMLLLYTSHRRQNT